MKQRCELDAQVIVSIAVDVDLVGPSTEMFEKILEEEMDNARQRIKDRINELEGHESLYSEQFIGEAEFGGIISC